MDWLHFLNLQYWYCVISSLFGAHCAYLDELQASQPTTKSPGFFEQLFGGIIGAAGTVWGLVAGVVGVLWAIYSIVAWTLSGLLLFGIVAALGGLLWIRFLETSTYGTLPPRTEKEFALRDRWNALLERTLSTNPNDWKVSVLEADRMMGDLLGTLGYGGATTPDKMRALSDDAFVTVPQAWEAHRVRNFISNPNSDFILTQREAYRVMKLYEQVFEEHNYL